MLPAHPRAQFSETHPVQRLQKWTAQINNTRTTADGEASTAHWASTMNDEVEGKGESQ
jgi:hypothetical protein